MKKMRNVALVLFLPALCGCATFRAASPAAVDDLLVLVFLGAGGVVGAVTWLLAFYARTDDVQSLDWLRPTLRAASPAAVNGLVLLVFLGVGGVAGAVAWFLAHEVSEDANRSQETPISTVRVQTSGPGKVSIDGAGISKQDLGALLASANAASQSAAPSAFGEVWHGAWRPKDLVKLAEVDKFEGVLADAAKDGLAPSWSDSFKAWSDEEEDGIYWRVATGDQSVPPRVTAWLSKAPTTRRALTYRSPTTVSVNGESEAAEERQYQLIILIDD